MLKKGLIIFLLICACFLTSCTANKKQETIVFASWGSITETAILKHIIADFEKDNPDIKINFMHIPQNYFPKIHLLFASNTEPDVIFINNLNIPVYAKKLENLTNIINHDDFYTQSIEGLSYNGELLAIPRDISNLVLYINKDIFKSKNVPVPNEDWTLNDLLEISKKLTDDKTYAISHEKGLYYAMPYITYYGGGILSDDLNNIIIDTPESQKGLIFYKDLCDKYHIAPTNSDTGSLTSAQMFLNGKLAMYLSGRWLYPKIKEQANFNWQIINFPYGKNGVLCDTSGWAITKNSKHKESAIKFIQYLASEQGSKYFTQSELIIPANKKSTKYLNDTTHNEIIFIKIIKNSVKNPINKNYKKLTDKYSMQYDL